MNNDKLQNVHDNPLQTLEELCKYPVLYINTHFADDDGEKSFVVSVSNQEPIIIKDKREALWEKNALVVDVFYDPTLTLNNINPEVLISITYWVKILCCILTFKGHEVFIENKLFRPYENDYILK